MRQISQLELAHPDDTRWWPGSWTSKRDCRALFSLELSHLKNVVQYYERKKKSPLHLVSCCDGTYDMYEYFGICTLHLEKIPRAQYLYFLAIFRRYLFVFEHFRRAHGLSSTPLRDPLIAGRVRSRSAMLSRGRVRT